MATEKLPTGSSFFLGGWVGGGVLGVPTAQEGESPPNVFVVVFIIALSSFLILCSGVV